MASRLLLSNRGRFARFRTIPLASLPALAVPDLVTPGETTFPVVDFMAPVITEIVLIFLLLAANGVFAMAEIALVSAKRARLKTRADEGDKGAAAALALAESPNRFLSTVQIGITIVGIFAGAFGGARIAARLAPVLADIPGVGAFADQLAFALVIVALTYLSLVLGELLPKRLAMLQPEAISSFMARPMNVISHLASPAVRFLSWSTDLLVGLLGVKASAEHGPSKEEVTVLIREGIVTGAFKRAETEMVEGVLELNDIKVSEIMTPGPRLLWLNAEDDHSTVWHKIVGSNHRYFPLYDHSRENLLGVVSVKSLYSHLAAGLPIHFRDVVTPTAFVPEQQTAMQLLETFKQTGVHVAFVVDEFGNVVGMATLVDILEAIVGDVPTREARSGSDIQQRADGSWLIDALVDLETLSEKLSGFALPEGSGDAFVTVAGFIIAQLQHLPKEGESIEHTGWRLEVIDMDGHRVDKVLATPLPVVPPATPPKAN
jgi:putative hemolysin